MMKIGSAAIKSLAIVRNLKALHKKAFSDKYLLVTNVGISFGLSSAGDVLEQQYERWQGELSEWNPTRTTHMAISGISVGIICHYWYKILDHRLPGKTIRVVMKKILLDQLICSPVYITAFFITMGLLERKTRTEVVEEIKEKAWKLYAAEWMVWPTAQFINFYWLPTRYRILYDNIISLGYDVYTSQVKHQSD